MIFDCGHLGFETIVLNLSIILHCQNPMLIETTKGIKLFIESTFMYLCYLLTIGVSNIGLIHMCVEGHELTQ